MWTRRLRSESYKYIRHFRRVVVMIKRLAGAAIFLIIGSAVCAVGQDLPKPDLRFVNARDVVISEKRFRMYEIEVVNRAEFLNELFVPAPDLPPCGRNTNASRTWIEFFNEKGDRIYGHCAINSNEKLKAVMFMVPAEAKQPAKVFVDFNDRRENNTVRSNTVDVEN